MDLSPQDFANYAQAAGVPYPRNAAERAAMAPAVMQWKQQSAAAQEQPEGRSALATAGLAALLSAGVGGAGVGGYHLWKNRPGEQDPAAGPVPPGGAEATGSPAGPDEPGGGGGPASTAVPTKPVWPEEAYRAPRDRHGRLRPNAEGRIQTATKGGFAEGMERGSYSVMGNPMQHPVLGPKIAAVISETDPAAQIAQLRKLDDEVKISGSQELQSNWNQLKRQLLEGAGSRYGVKADNLEALETSLKSAVKDAKLKWEAGVDLDDSNVGPWSESENPGEEEKKTVFRVKSKLGATRSKEGTLGVSDLADDVYASQKRKGDDERERFEKRERPERNWEPIVGDRQEALGNYIDAIEGDTGAEGSSLPVPFSRTTPRGEGDVGYRGKIQSELAKTGKAPDENYNYRNTAGRTLTDRATRKLLQQAGYRPETYSRTGTRPLQRNEGVVDDPGSNGLTGQWVNNQWVESGESLGGFARQVQESYDYRVKRLGHRPSAQTMRKATAFVQAKAETEAANALRTVLVSATQVWPEGIKDADLVATAGTVARVYGMDENDAVKIIRNARELDSTKAPVRKTSTEWINWKPTPSARGTVVSDEDKVKGDVASYPVRIHNENTDILPGQQREAVTNRALAAARQLKAIVKADPAVKSSLARQQDHTRLLAAAYGVEPSEVIGALRGIKAAENRQAPENRLQNPAPSWMPQQDLDEEGRKPLNWTTNLVAGLGRAPKLSLSEQARAAQSTNPEESAELAQHAMGWIPEILGITPGEDGKLTVSGTLRAEKGLAPLKDMDIKEQISVVGEALAAAAQDYGEALEIARNHEDPLVREAGERAYAGGRKGSNEFKQFASSYVKEYVQLRALLQHNNDPDRPARVAVPAGESAILALRSINEGKSIDDLLNHRIQKSGSLADGVLDIMASTIHLNQGMPIRMGGEIGEEARTYGDLIQIVHRRSGSAQSAMGKLKNELSRQTISPNPSLAGAPVRGIQIHLTPSMDETQLMRERQGLEHELMAEVAFSPVERYTPDEQGWVTTADVETGRGKLHPGKLVSTLEGRIGELENRNKRLKNPIEGRDVPADLDAALLENENLLARYRGMLSQLNNHPGTVNLAISAFNTGGRHAANADNIAMLGTDPQSGTTRVERIERRRGIQSFELVGGENTSEGAEAMAAADWEVRPNREAVDAEEIGSNDPWQALEASEGLEGQMPEAPELESTGETPARRRVRLSANEREIRRQNARIVLDSLGGRRQGKAMERTETSLGRSLQELERFVVEAEEGRGFTVGQMESGEYEKQRQDAIRGEEKLPPMKHFNYDAVGSPRLPAQNAYVAGVSSATPRQTQHSYEVPAASAYDSGALQARTQEKKVASAARRRNRTTSTEFFGKLREGPEGTRERGGEIPQTGSASLAVQEQLRSRLQASQMPIASAVPSKQPQADPNYMGGMDHHREAAQMANFWDALVARGLAPAASGEAVQPVTPFQKLIGRELDARAQEMAQADLDRGIPLRASAPPEQEAVGVLVREPWNRWRHR